MTCIRQYRHILMFKRAGRGHEPGGIAETPAGACAVVCPACPNFDFNLPKDWATRPFQCVGTAALDVLCSTLSGGCTASYCRSMQTSVSLTA